MGLLTLPWAWVSHHGLSINWLQAHGAGLQDHIVLVHISEINIQRYKGHPKECDLQQHASAVRDEAGGAGAQSSRPAPTSRTFRVDSEIYPDIYCMVPSIPQRESHKSSIHLAPAF